MKKINHIIQLVIIKIFFTIFRIIGFRASSKLGFLIGKYFGPIFRSKELIINNLKKANIDKKNNFEKIASNVLGNYGRIFSEYVHLKNFKNDSLQKYFSIEGLNYLKNIKKNGEKVVFISGHFNNFELMAMQIEKAGVDCAAIYRPLNNPYLNSIMETIRIRDICKNQIKKGRSGTRQIIKNLKNGCSVALMIDQRVREGSKVKFFGNLATTTTIPAQLIQKYKCELVPIYIERKKKYHFIMHISKPIKVKSNKTTEEITLFLNSILEKMILKNPEQWIWTHDRWKK